MLVDCPQKIWNTQELAQIVQLWKIWKCSNWDKKTDSSFSAENLQVCKTVRVQYSMFCFEMWQVARQ